MISTDSFTFFEILFISHTRAYTESDKTKFGVLW